MLQDCGYNGAQPYWDWSLNVGSPTKFSSSPIFDPTTGFGGTGPYVPGNFSNPQPGLFVSAPFDIPGRTGGGCIPNGPFANWMPKVGPGPNVQSNPHCVRRDFSSTWFNSTANSTVISSGISQPNFGWLDRTTEYTIHGSGHFGVGGLYGTMSDLWSSSKSSLVVALPLQCSLEIRTDSASANDPIFWLHHANMDRYWWSWQAKDLKTRLSDFSGPLIAMDYDNQKGGNATLDTEIRIGQSVNITLKVRDVMNIQGSVLCYAYDKLIT